MFLYGANYSIAKIALPEYVQPYGFVAIRVVMAFLMLAIFHALAIKEKIENKDLPKVALCALFGVVINQIFFLKGLSLTSEIHASLIMISTPILILVLSAVFLKEKITWTKSFGILLGAGGVAWLILQGGAGGDSKASQLGDLFILINACSYGGYLVLVKPLMSKYNPITIIKWMFFFGMFIVIPFGFNQFIMIDWAGMPTEALFSVAYVVIGATFLTYVGNAIAIKELDASIVGIYIYLQPFIASSIAVALGNDVFTLEKLLSGLLVITGVMLASGFIKLRKV
ncbi:MAG: drug/metabolite transporter (DMT)-like permease [Limisphaerales bacterium]|jgi:drug/metabolite transporter (DMT)-like permease